MIDTDIWREMLDGSPEPMVTLDVSDVHQLLDELDAASTRAKKAEAAVARLKEREDHFARALGIPDGGQYRNDWDARLTGLLEERDDLAAAITRVRKLHRPMQLYAACPDDGCDRDDCYCYEGTDIAGSFYHQSETDGVACEHCWADLGYKDHEWPCPTIRALEGVES